MLKLVVIGLKPFVTAAILTVKSLGSNALLTTDIPVIAASCSSALTCCRDLTCSCCKYCRLVKQVFNCDFAICTITCVCNGFPITDLDKNDPYDGWSGLPPTSVRQILRMSWI